MAIELALIQMNSPGPPEENLAKAEELVDRAVEGTGADIVVLPEFFNTIYFAQYRDYELMKLAEPEDGPATTSMRARARRHGVHIVSTIWEQESAGVYYDTAIDKTTDKLIDPDGEIVGKYRKVQPAAVQSLEKIYFRYGSRFPVFTVGELRVGFIVCYDTFFPESARCAALNGAELIIVPFAAPQQLLWRDVMRARAFENGVYFAPCNKVGTEGEWTFGGQSMIVDPLGEVLAEASATDDEIISATVDRDIVGAARVRYPMFRDRRPDLYRPICSPTEDLRESG
jgi:predicted amidohydrolase